VGGGNGGGGKRNKKTPEREEEGEKRTPTFSKKDILPRVERMLEVMTKGVTDVRGRQNLSGGGGLVGGVSKRQRGWKAEVKTKSVAWRETDNQKKDSTGEDKKSLWQIQEEFTPKKRMGVGPLFVLVEENWKKKETKRSQQKRQEKNTARRFTSLVLLPKVFN